MYVQTQADLEALCERAREVGRFGIDLEFIRERTYYPQLALIQVAVSNGAGLGHEELALVDPLGELDLAPLEELIHSEDVLKILHAPTQDLEIFYHRTGRAPAAIFDTQLAAAMLGLGNQVSYAALVERVTGHKPRKGEAFTNWLHRPLSPEQEEYALDDVRYLHAVHEGLLGRLSELGRAQWVDEEFEKFLRAELYDPEPGTLYQKVRRFGTLRGDGLAILRELAIWREQEARHLDRPRRRIVADEVLVEIARSAPLKPEPLRRIRGLHPQLFNRSHQSILAAVERGRRVSPEDRPRLDRGRRLDPDGQLMVNFLDACLRAHCQREHLDPTLVATSSDLQAFVGDYLEGRLDPSNHSVLRGWRGELVGQELLAFLEGKIGIRIDPKTRRPALEDLRE